MDIFVGLAYASGTRTVSIHELETEFSAPFRHVLSGEEIVILDHGREVARISPVDSDAADVIPAGDDAKLVASGATKLLQRPFKRRSLGTEADGDPDAVKCGATIRFLGHRALNGT